MKPVTTIRVSNNPETDCCDPCSGCWGTCFNFKYFKTTSGCLKIIELMIGSLCQTLLLNFGLKYASLIGFSYDAFLATVSSCLSTTAILCVCYGFHSNSMKLIKASVFEIVFNAFASSSFLGSSSFLVTSVNTSLYPHYLIVPFYFIYPIMIAVYILGFLLGLIYAYDSYKAYKYYMGYR